MKIHYQHDRGRQHLSSIVTLTLGMILAAAGAVRSQPLQIAPGFPEPLSVSGVSGGANNSGESGFGAAGPNSIAEGMSTAADPAQPLAEFGAGTMVRGGTG